MARARTLKPGFFIDGDLGELKMEARYLFEGLWCLADKAGRLKDKPRDIKVQVLPWDDFDVDKLLDDLSPKFIIRYEVKGQRYIQINNFAKHQNPHHTEKESSIPDVSCSLTVKEPLNNGESPVNEQLDSCYNPAVYCVPCTDPSVPIIPIDCAEPSTDAEALHRNNGTPPEVIITLTLNDKTEYPIFEEQTHEWAALYPSVDVIQELRNMKGWINGNPTKRKTKSGILKFVYGWLAREQNKGKNGKSPRGPDPPSRDAPTSEKNYDEAFF